MREKIMRVFSRARPMKSPGCQTRQNNGEKHARPWRHDHASRLWHKVQTQNFFILLQWCELYYEVVPVRHSCADTRMMFEKRC